MRLTSGSRLGPYEIVAPLGEGGMGEVYRARDTRLGRDVAIKVLPQHLSGDPVRRERFEREARSISNLNHPNICTLYDVGSQGTDAGVIEFLVMEHIEGETLADRLAKGPLPIEQVLRRGMEIADALDKAHRQGVIHRDLKPQNVMLTKSGAKLLDFGLAKLTEGRGAAQPGGLRPDGSVLPTATRNLTTAGTILGTFQYMAPEQLEGKEADARTDLFTFGVVLYEMATGRKAFEGKSQASLIAAILKEQPRPIVELQPLSPAGLDRVVRSCLAKDPDERAQTARDVKMHLEWVADGSLSGTPAGAAAEAARPARSPAAVRSGGRPTIWIAAAAVLLFGAAMGGLGWWLHPPAPHRILRVNLELPPKTQLDAQNSSLALSPDGLTLAYAATGPDGRLRLWVRPLDSLQSQPLAGTENATYPFWSPDSRFLGFFADQKLKKVPASGGTVQTLCEAQDGRGGSWGAGGEIVFAPAPYGGLQLISSAGGAPAVLTTTESDSATHRLPHFLPDGRRLLFFVSRPGKDSVAGIHAVDLKTKAITLVAREKSGGRYVAPGYLVFVREGNLLAQRMDPATLKLSGEAVPIAEKVQFNPSRWTGAFTLSDSGLLLYKGGAGVVKSRLTWFDLDGKEQGAVGEPANFLELALSPDARRAAATVLTVSGLPDLWLYDLVRGVGSRFTFAPEGASSPIWSPDGRQIAYVDTTNRVFVKAADGASEPRALLPEPGANRQLTGWLPDGSCILLWSQNPRTSLDIDLLPVGGDGKLKPLLATAANEHDAEVSPDGRWMLYVSDESGRQEAYVVAYPGPGSKWQVSTAGAMACRWMDAGRRVVYGDLEGKIMVVDVTAQGGSLVIGPPRGVFGGRTVNGPAALARDGRRILIASPVEEATLSNLVLVTDWTAALQK